VRPQVCRPLELISIRMRPPRGFDDGKGAYENQHAMVSSTVTPHTSFPADQSVETRADGIVVGPGRPRPQHATSELVRRAQTPFWSMVSDATDVLVGTGTGVLLQAWSQKLTES
jgi:hypothetical protein